MNKDTYIRSSKVTLKFANNGKRASMLSFIQEYQRVVRLYIEKLWVCEKIPTLVTFKVDSWLSARALQAAGKQASGIVRGTRQKQSQREYVISRLLAEGKTKEARELQAIQDASKVSQPSVKNCNPELDQRFVSFRFDQATSFDGWLTLGSLGHKLKIQIPIKKTKHFNGLQAKGQILKGCRLSKDSVTFMFKVQKPAPLTEGNVLGIDVGQTTAISCSDGQTSTQNSHGHDLKSISEILVRRQRGSKGFKRAQSHRENYINWAINRLNFNEVKTVRVENIKGLRYKKTTSKSLNHWTYTEIFGKLESKFEELGVQVSKVNPRYTSQRCSECGWVRKSNRKGKRFLCGKCHFELDADLNGARNIGLELPSLTTKQREKNANKVGFYWTLLGKEHIVPCDSKHVMDIFP